MILVKMYFLYSLGSMLPLGILPFRLRKSTSHLWSNMHCCAVWNCVKLKMIILFLMTQPVVVQTNLVSSLKCICLQIIVK